MSAHDVFRFGGLGKTAGELWEALREGPASADDLAVKTGRHVKTVRRNLERMSRIIDVATGEVLRMIAVDGECWYALEGVDLDQIARIFGTLGASARQHEQHLAQREARREVLRAGRLTKAERQIYGS